MLGSMRACANCGVSLADDQRYCLECGARQVQARSQFLERFTPAAAGPSVPAAPPLNTGGRSANATALAGIGVLLLAMGVGVLIGRASGAATSTAPPQVISVASPAAASGAAGTEASGSGAATGASEIPEDWPAGKSGYSVQLQTFSSSAAQAAEVTAAKSAALSKGATAVGVLLSSNFASLPADKYVIYSGDYSSEAQAKQALTKLKSKFSSAAVIHVSGATGASSPSSSSSSSSPSSSSSSGSSTGGAKTSGSGSSKGSSSPSSSSNSTHSYEQKSLNLPNVVTTG
jgi:SPOR domain